MYPYGVSLSVTQAQHSSRNVPWVELAALLRTPSTSLPARMAERARAEGPELDVAHLEVSEAFSDRRVARYSTLVGIVNNWPEKPDADGRRPHRRLGVVRPRAARARMRSISPTLESRTGSAATGPRAATERPRPAARAAG
jgi:hypothetical protein